MEWTELQVHEFVDACLVCITRPMIQRFVAAAFGVVAERATLLAQQSCATKVARVIR